MRIRLLSINSKYNKYRLPSRVRICFIYCFYDTKSGGSSGLLFVLCILSDYGL